MSKGKILLSIVAGVFAIYVVAGPYITVYQIKSAAERHDGEALSEHIDFPSVRQSFKDQLNAMFAKKMLGDENMKNNPLAAFGVAFAGLMVDKMVDVYVTPSGITQLMSGEKPKPFEKPQPVQGQSADRSDNQGRKPLSGASMSYESLEKFVVKVKLNEDGKEEKFVLRRQGLTWKLTDIIVPL